MLEKHSDKYERVSQTIDAFMRLDYTGVGFIGPIFEALSRRQPGHVCMRAAELITTALRLENDARGPVVIATGFPEGGGVPETDGPVGAAMLARAIFLAFGTPTVILVDEDWFGMMEATCRGAGLAPMPFPEDGVITAVDFLRPVYIRTVPKNDDAAHLVSEKLLNFTKPSLIIAIERPGANTNGLYHGLGGRPLDGMIADLDYLFARAKVAGIPTIGIGDGGNEIGMGVIAADLPTFYAKARDCGIAGRGGVGAQTATDILVASNVSNWGATGIIAALSALLENPIIFHDPELEVRCIEACVSAGGVDGMFMAPEAAVDGISVLEWEGLIRTLRLTVQRTLGLSVNWKGQQGDWRKLR
jgi:hypothetical protein